MDYLIASWTRAHCYNLCSNSQISVLLSDNKMNLSSIHARMRYIDRSQCKDWHGFQGLYQWIQLYKSCPSLWPK